MFSIRHKQKGSDWILISGSHVEVLIRLRQT